MAGTRECAPRGLEAGICALSQTKTVRSRHLKLALLLPLLLASSNCRQPAELPAPPKIDSKIEFGEQKSAIAIPVMLSLDRVQSDLNMKLPVNLWSINERRDKCIPGQRLKVFKKRLKVTPDLGCTIVGSVKRGRIKLRASGKNIFLTIPVEAKVSARDVGGFLKGETATGSAIVRTRVSFKVTPAWDLVGKVVIDYDWAEPPGIDFLGQRIRFVRLADKELQKILRDLEADLQRQISKARLRELVAKSWSRGFTTIELNRARPPAWMRVTPKTLALADFSATDREVRLNVVATAITETFIGDRPTENPATPVPAPGAPIDLRGFHFRIPVVSSYSQIEPVILRALRKLNKKGIRIGKNGKVDADFQKVTVYATTGNRLAVGIEAKIVVLGRSAGQRYLENSSTIWFTGTPVQEPNSQILRVKDLKIFAKSDSNMANMLFELANTDEFRSDLQNSIVEDLSKDYKKVIDKAKIAIADREISNLRLITKIEKVEHGVILVRGQGLYMPLEAWGQAKILVN